MGNKLLIIGASGELGMQVIKQSSSPEIFLTYYKNNSVLTKKHIYRMDVTDNSNVYKVITDLRPDIVINTSVSDRSIKNLSDREARRAIVDGTINVAEASSKIGARSIHISTDLVFDGLDGSYREESKTNPLSRYGRYKAEMENRLLSLDYDLAIVRTSLIITFEPMGHQVLWIVNSLLHKKELNLYADEFRSPVLGEDLAKAILELSKSDYKGLINIAGPEDMSRYELGVKIADCLVLNKGLIKPVLSSCTDLSRPYNCTLDSSLANSLLKMNIRKISDLV